MQSLVDFFLTSILLYLPPIGFALLILIFFIIQPIVAGAVNVALLQRFYGFEGWQIDLWLNGLFLLLVLMSVNLLLRLTLSIYFSLYLGIAEMFLLAYPFGYLGKFSNTGYSKPKHQPDSDIKAEV